MIAYDDGVELVYTDKISSNFSCCYTYFELVILLSFSLTASQKRICFPFKDQYIISGVFIYILMYIYMLYPYRTHIMSRIEGAIWFVIFTVNIMGRIYGTICVQHQIRYVVWVILLIITHINVSMTYTDLFQCMETLTFRRRQEENGYWF